MAATVTEYQINHFFENDKHDFNTLRIPHDLKPHLIAHLRNEWDTKRQMEFAAEMRLERAKQHDRYIQHCKENDLQPKQIFIDFPVT